MLIHQNFNHPSSEADLKDVDVGFVVGIFPKICKHVYILKAL